MRKATFRQRIGYRFDTFMARGTSAMLLGLAVATVLVIAVAALLVLLTGTAPDGQSLVALLWMGLMHTIDSGAVGGDAGAPFFLGVMLAVTVAGMFVFGALIGILNTGLESRLDAMRKGRSVVLESGHTLILGWSPQVFTVISELVGANESRKSGAVVVVLADEDKVEMEDAIRERVPDTKNTRVICRSGSPVDLSDLEIGSPHEARSIIVLPVGEDPDAHTIKTVLAVTNNPHRHEEPYHVVAQLADARNVDVVRILGARDTVLPILANNLIARVAAQTSRQSGLSVIYTELMDFGGDEIYMTSEPALTGKTYGDALSAYGDCSVIGLQRGDGTVWVNPPADASIAATDRIVAIAEDDDRVLLSGTAPAPDERVIRSGDVTTEARAERALVLGWNASGPVIVHELDEYVAPGSQVTIVCDADGVEDAIAAHGGSLANQTVTVRQGDIRDRALLESLGAADYDHVIVLAYAHLGAQQADAITLVTLLHLRDIAERDETPFSIVSEMLDLRNRELAEATKVDDFIVSEHLVSLMLAQLSENATLAAVFDDIFDAEGSEIYLKPAVDYVAVGEAVDFYAVVESARRRGETAIGYRVMADARDASKSYGVCVNPPKASKVTFGGEDRVIVLAE
ncbi:MAG: potassium transporter TrkA, partial [Actinobacteria bacterium]